jgi:AraC family transcriptional regulator
MGARITLDAMAAVAALSPFHFARAFTTTTGMAPHRFVTARRLEAAKSALLTTDASVVQVAHAVGFSNVSHFRRVFRRELGVLPGELRRWSARSTRAGPCVPGSEPCPVRRRF